MDKRDTIEQLIAQAKQYVPMTHHALVDFATQTWGPAPAWMWSGRPVYTNDEADRFRYAWTGAVSKTDCDMSRDWLTADERLCICLEGTAGKAERFRVMTFRDYAYNRRDNLSGDIRAAYLTVTAVSLTTKLTDEAVRRGMTLLYAILKQQPVSLLMEGYDHPQLETRTELAPGIVVQTRVLAKHT